MADASGGGAGLGAGSGGGDIGAAATGATAGDELAGRSALVTGAGNGLGRAIALGLARAGARVVLVGRTQSKLTETAALLPDPKAARVAVCDVSSPAAVETLRADLDAEGEQIDILINNAGIGGPVKPLTEIDPGEWDEVFADRKSVV